MTNEQRQAIRCAFADLCGVMQAYKQGDISIHDWKAHSLTINEMSEAFDFLDPIPANLGE